MDTVEAYKPLPFSPGQRTRVVLTAHDAPAPFTPAYVQSLLTRVADPAALYDERVRGRRVALANPARRRGDAHTPATDEPTTTRKARARARVRGGWRLEPGAERFALFVPLHRLWMGYVSELLGLSPPPAEDHAPHADRVPNAAVMHAKLVKADLHGSWLAVQQSRNPCLVGLAGIVLHESENAFRVVTRADRVKLLPKRGSVFTLAVPLYSALAPPPATVLDGPHLAFELYGSHFCYRAAERAGRKFKAKETIEL